MSEQKNHNGYGTVYQDKPGIDKWDGTVPVLGPDGEYFDAYVDLWEDRAPADGTKHIRNIRVRAKNYRQHKSPAGGQVERETAAPVGAPTRIGREQGPPPAYTTTPHPGAVKASSMPYSSEWDSYSDIAEPRDNWNPYLHPDNPQRVGGPDE